MKYCKTITILLSLSISHAFAGAMGAVEPTYDFNGLYVGLGAGYTAIAINNSFVTTRSDGVGGNAGMNRYTHTDAVFSGQLGYGKMFQERVYLGGKASIQYTPLNALDETGFSTAAGSALIIGSNSIRTTVKPIYNIDAVLGYEIYPHFLPFVEAGVSFADVNHNYEFKRTRTNIATLTNVGYQSLLNLDGYSTGYNVGLGLNYQPFANWILTGEAVYTDLGKNSGLVTVAIPSSTATETHSRTISNSAISMMFSVSYLFNC